jgi:phosphotransferase family enzyme
MDATPGSPLHAAVVAATGRPEALIADAHPEPLEYDAFLAHRTVRRITGVAIDGHERIPWSLIEKWTDGPAVASPYLIDNTERELAAYRSGLLADLAPRLRAPRPYGSLVDSDGAVTLWIEDVAHQGARPLDAAALLAAARDLGAMAGRWLGHPLDEPWLFGGWIARHSQPEAWGASERTLSTTHPAVVARLGDRLAGGVRLLRAQERVRGILESLPLTLCHHDAVGANVFRSHGDTVLIDWESVGPGPAGADLASLLFASVRRGDASAFVVGPLIEAAFDAYLEGMREQAPALDADAVRLGFDAAIVLRWKLLADLAETIESAGRARRGSAPGESPEVAMAELIELADVLLRESERVLDSDTV